MATELYHSDTYLGKDYSDGIRHFKYIKRVRKNGRWVYYYQNDTLDTLEKNMNRAKVRQQVVDNKAKLKDPQAYSDYKERRVVYNDNKYGKSMMNAEKAARRAVFEYKLEKVVTAPTRAIAKGTAAAANAISKLMQKLKKKLKK